MKKYLNLLIAILFTLSLNAGGGKAKIVFDSTRYDFGYIQEDKGKVFCCAILLKHRKWRASVNQKPAITCKRSILFS